MIMRATQINVALGDAITGTLKYKPLQFQKVEMFVSAQQSKGFGADVSLVLKLRLPGGATVHRASGGLRREPRQDVFQIGLSAYAICYCLQPSFKSRCL